MGWKKQTKNILKKRIMVAIDFEIKADINAHT